MTYLEQIEKNVRELVKNDFAEVKSIVNELIAGEDEDTLVRLNQEQMDEGLRADGKKTKKYESDTYRRRFNKPTYRNYKLTGDFHGSINAKAEQGNVNFYALDEKSRFLEEQEDGQLLGITEENKVTVFNKNINKIRDAISRRIKGL